MIRATPTKEQSTSLCNCEVLVGNSKTPINLMNTTNLNLIQTSSSELNIDILLKWTKCDTWVAGHADVLLCTT